jgi:Peptidase A4 family
MNRTVRRLASAASGLMLIGFALPAAAATGAAGGYAGGVVHITHGVGGTVNTNQSSNWSGYNIGADYPQVPTGTLFTAVSGEWRVPTASLHSSADSAEDSATWVGIGGGCVEDSCTVTDNTLIQAGTEQDVTNSGGTVTTSYDAWWEIIPEPETEVSLPVAPGDLIKVTIAETSTPGDWSIEIQNLTEHKKFTTTTPYSSSEDTVEWIEETPLEIGTTGTGLATMPNLTKVHIDNATYNTANPQFQTIDEMQLDNNDMIEATPSAPGPKKNTFNDCTWATKCGRP